MYYIRPIPALIFLKLIMSLVDRMCVAYFMSHRINQQTNLSFIFRVLASQGINHAMGMRWVHEAATKVWWRF
jgi:hypothetical protein